MKYLLVTVGPYGKDHIVSSVHHTLWKEYSSYLKNLAV